MISDKQAQQISDWTSDMLALSDVKRWVVVHTLRNQSVADHSFRVAIIAISICGRLGLPDQGAKWTLQQVITWALWHDVPEGLTGDIDGKFKHSNPDVKLAITRAEMKAFPWCEPENEIVRWIVKVADLIETSTFIQANATGPRAEDIYREQTVLLFESAVPRLCEVLELDMVTTTVIVRNIVHESVSEANSRQLRRHRRS